MRLSMGLDMDCGKMQCFLDFWEWRCMERGGRVRSSGWKGTARFLLRLAELLSASSGCDTQPDKLAARKPALIGRLRGDGPETLVNTGLADRQAGNARKQWAGGQGIRRWPFYAGFRAGVVADIVVGLRPPAAAIQPAMRSSRAVGSRARSLVMFVAPAASRNKYFRKYPKNFYCLNFVFNMRCLYSNF